MTTETIGNNAGAVWRLLDSAESPLTVKEIKKGAKLSTQNEVFIALGWLAKEDKLIFGEEEKDFTVSLKK